MRIITNISRLMVGLLFIFSGFIKLNDPRGFSYKLEEYFTVFAEDLSAKQDTFFFSLETQDQTIKESSVLLASEQFRNFQLSSGPWESITQTDSASEEETIAGYRTEVYVSSGDNSIGSFEVHASDSSPIGMNMRLQCGDYNEEVPVQISVTEAVNVSKTAETSALIKSDGWLVGFFNGLKPYALAIGIFVCVLEVLLGWALLIGWQSALVVWLLFLLIVFFTFLTGYSAIYNKVTDCGCFGNAIPLTPWESFYKDLILSALIIILMMGRKYIRSLYSMRFSVRFLVSMAVLFTGFAIYCLSYLPVFNFLEYEKGADIAQKMKIPEGERVSPHKVMEYIYSNGSEEVVVIYDTEKNTFEPAIDPSWSFVRVGVEKILEEAYEPPIHDFHLYQADRMTDDLDSFLQQDGYKILLVMHQLHEANAPAMKKVKDLAQAAEENGIPFWALTASSSDKAEVFRHEHQLPFDFHYGDDTNLKSIIRSNPGLLLLKNTEVLEDWSSRRIPDVQGLKKNMN